MKAGKADRAAKVERKIKQTGTMSGRFVKLLLSAHCISGPRAAPWFSPSRAAILRKALAVLCFDRHHGRRIPDCRHSRPGVRS